MKTDIIINIATLIGGIFFCVLPFIRVGGRVRDKWANIAVFLIGLLEAATSSVYIMWDSGWFAMQSHNAYRNLHIILIAFGGVTCGLIASLVLSGQVTGKKRPPNTALGPTPTAH
jgi:hypothetical protein